MLYGATGNGTEGWCGKHSANLPGCLLVLLCDHVHGALLMRMPHKTLSLRTWSSRCLQVVTECEMKEWKDHEKLTSSVRGLVLLAEWSAWGGVSSGYHKDPFLHYL